MKIAPRHYLYVFLITVIAVLTRPCFVFAAQPLSSSQQSNTSDIRQLIRKRNEFNQGAEDCIITSETRKRNPSIKILFRKFQMRLLVMRSYFSSHSVFFLKKQATAFQISPHNDEYVNLSVFRI